MNIAKIRSFPGADIRSDHELVNDDLQAPPPKGKKQGSIRIRFSLEKLKDPNIAETFRATIGGKFVPLLALENQDTEIDALINSLTLPCQKQPITSLANTDQQRSPGSKKLCDKRRELKHKKNTTEGAKLYREANQQVKKGMRKAKETWIEEQCQDIE